MKAMPILARNPLETEPKPPPAVRYPAQKLEFAPKTPPTTAAAIWPPHAISMKKVPMIIKMLQPSAIYARPLYTQNAIS